MKTTFSLVMLIALGCAAIGGDPRSPKQFNKGVAHTVQGDFFWDHCTEGNSLRYVVFSYDGFRPRELGQSKWERYAKVSAAASRNPKATLYDGPSSEIDLFHTQEQIYQVEKGGQVKTYNEQVSLEEFRSFMGSGPPAITAEALIAHVNDLRSERQ